MQRILGPNTKLDSRLMQKNILLSCGEDTKELLTPLAEIEEFSDYHEYRCYKFWKFSTFTLIWTGFGTSCLEPLLWEILKPNIAERIILFGSQAIFLNQEQNSVKRT